MLHLVFVLHIQEVSRPLGKNVPEGTACAQMLEVFRHVTCQNDGLCEFFGAFGFLVGLSDMVWQQSSGNLFSRVGKGLQAYSLSEHFTFTQRAK